VWGATAGVLGTTDATSGGEAVPPPPLSWIKSREVPCAAPAAAPVLALEITAVEAPLPMAGTPVTGAPVTTRLCGKPCGGKSRAPERRKVAEPGAPPTTFEPASPGRNGMG
jgi:hypothetical protein